MVLSGKVRKARRRVEAASAAVTEEKKLGNITTSALDFLLRYTQISVILEALMKLGECVSLLNVLACKLPGV